jgi:hypothetical protein
MDWRKEVEELGMEAERRELARSLSTAALRRYAIAVRLLAGKRGETEGKGMEVPYGQFHA